MKFSEVVMRSLFKGRRAFVLAWCAYGLLVPIAAHAASSTAAEKPIVVLVHGAFADSGTWDGVISRLQADGYTAVAAANPLRGLTGDAASVASVVKSIHRPVVLVGHSYGGSVVTNAATSADNVKALVYVSALAPDEGESAFDLIGRFPGSLIGSSLAPPVALDDSGKDLYVDQKKYRLPLAQDVSATRVNVLAATQRPVTEGALKEPSGAPAWKSTPSWFIYGTADKCIPPALYQFMAKRAEAKETVAVKSASHLLLISHPDAVAKLIEDAARSTNYHR